MGQLLQHRLALSPILPPGGISGQVTDTAQNVIAGALVRAYGPNGHNSVLQTADGYTITGLPPGRYWVYATADSFQSGHYPDSVLVTTNQTTPDIDFALNRVPPPTTGSMSGLVTDAVSGDPLLYARIVADGPTHKYSYSYYTGEYTMTGLFPGRYGVVAQANGFVTSAVESVDVVAGQTTPNVNFALQPSASGTGVISGMVSDSSTQLPVLGALVIAWGVSGQSRAYSDTDGGYSITNIVPGTYHVRVYASGYYPAYWPESLSIANGQTILGVNFPLRRVNGFGAGFGGFVAEGFSLQTVPGAQVTAVGAEGGHEVVADAVGNYVFEDLFAGEYAVLVEADGYEAQTLGYRVRVEQNQILGFVCPALWSPLTAVENPVTPTPHSVRLSVAPNPCGAFTMVSYALPIAGKFSLKLYDVTGQLVATPVQGDGPAGTATLKLPVPQLARGIYVLKLKTDNSTATRKLIVR